jgi:hypothetical protein
MVAKWNLKSLWPVGATTHVHDMLPVALYTYVYYTRRPTVQNDTAPSPNPNEVKPTEADSPSQVEQAQPAILAQSTAIPQAAVKHRVPWPLVVVVLVLLLAGATVAYWITLAPKTTKTAVTTTSTKQSVTPKAQGTDITKLMAGLQKELPGGTAPASGNMRAPDYKVPGYDFYASARGKDTTGVVYKKPVAELSATASQAASYLATNGFKKSTQQVKDPYYPLVKYENEDTFCGINYYSDSAEELQELYVACAAKTSYIPTAKLQKPLYDAYRAANKDNQYLTEDSRLGYPKIADSVTTGYKTAEAELYSEARPTGAVGLFYQTPDDAWHYFMGTQQTIGCESYNTTDLKEAFLGEACDSVGDGVYTQSTVQL